MRFLMLVLLGLTLACGGAEEPESGQAPIKTHDIEQLNVPDSGVESSDAGVLDQARIAVAYCAAGVLDIVPKYCEVLRDGSTLTTDCDTGLSITWNCERCGDVSKNDKLIGHVLMTSDYRFEVKSLTSKQGHVCLLAFDGHTFTIEDLK